MAGIPVQFRHRRGLLVRLILLGHSVEILNVASQRIALRFSVWYGSRIPSDGQPVQRILFYAFLLLLLRVSRLCRGVDIAGTNKHGTCLNVTERTRKLP